MSATHKWSGSPEEKLRPTRSGAACRRANRWVVLILRPRREPLSSLPGAADADGSEFGMYPGSSVGSATVAVNHLDLLQEHRVEAKSLRWRPVPPGIVTRARNPKKPAK